MIHRAEHFIVAHGDCRRPAFSLVELMIGIVILGLGLTMVATMFPIAWGRARTLSEFTVARAAAASAHDTVKTLARVADSSFTAAGFAGDLIYDPTNDAVYATDPVAWPSETWVHALNLENIQVQNRRFVDEDTWALSRAKDLQADLNIPGSILDGSYINKQVSFHQRIHPPMVLRGNVDFQSGLFTGDDDAWDSELDTRRFCWSVFHRLREPVSAPGATRLFDMYYVMLRRPQPTFRYARQNPTLTPSPYALSIAAVAPAALGGDQDVMFPVPWRVQVKFPAALGYRKDPDTGEIIATGLPTEIEVPPPSMTGSAEIKGMVVQMFQRNTQFIDEITGAIYRVARQRVTGAAADRALLTLDREVFIEDVNLPQGDPRCACVPDKVDAPELLRTVWVFPPPVAARPAGANALTFVGSQPVVEIEIRPLNLAPTN